MSDPIVTVLMTVRNGEPYLSEAVASILNQTFRDFRFLIVDNASTDNSREIIESFGDPRVQLVELPEDIGQTAALNLGLRMIDTPLVARMDADDIALPERLARQTAYMEAHPDVSLLGTQTDAIDAKGNLLFRFRYPCGHFQLLWNLLTECPLFHSSVMFRHEIVLNQFDGYDEHYRFSQDYDLWSRMAWDSRIASLPDVLTLWRVHESNTTSTFGSIRESEPLQISYRNIMKVGLEIDVEEWRLIRSVYLGRIEDKKSLHNSLSAMAQLREQFIQRCAPLHACDPDALRRWITRDVSMRFIYHFAALIASGDNAIAKAGLKELLAFDWRSAWYARRIILQLLFGAQSYSQLRRWWRLLVQNNSPASFQ